MNRAMSVRLGGALAALLFAVVAAPLAAQRQQNQQSLSQSAQLRDVYAPVVERARRSVVEVLSGDEVVCLGTAVARDLVVTKHSELRGEAIRWACRRGEQRWSVQLLGFDQPCDLALLRVIGPDLVPIEWAQAMPSPGAFFATPGLATSPLGVGILSTAPYVHTRPRAFLGVRFADAGRGAAELEQAVENGAARAAGLLAKDVVIGVDGAMIDSAQSLRERLQQHRPGDRIRLKVKRGDDELSFEVTLGSDSSAPQSSQEGIWGPLSGVRSGFAVVLQHDTVLQPKECGGPVVDLSGRAVGINIARAGRVETLALPVATVLATIERLGDGKAKSVK